MRFRKVNPAAPAVTVAAHHRQGYTVNMSKAALAENRPWTYADYKAWELAPGERYEIIYGEVYAMSALNTRHQAMLTELLSQIHSYLRGKSCKVYPTPFDVRLFYEEDESDDTLYSRTFPLFVMKKSAARKAAGAHPILL